MFLTINTFLLIVFFLVLVTLKISKMGIKAIVFDVDGVLFFNKDSGGKYLWSKNLKKDLGIKTKHCKIIYSKFWENVTKGKINTKKYLSNIFKLDSFNDIKITPDDYISYWLKKDYFINNNIINFIQTLNIDCYIGTNQDFYRGNNIKKLIGKNFKKIFISSEIGHIKPEPNFFHHIQSSLNLNGNEILLIDDKKQNIESARSLNWNTFLFTDNLDKLKNYLF